MGYLEKQNFLSVNFSTQLGYFLSGHSGHILLFFLFEHWGGEAKCIVLLFLYDCHYSGQVQLKETILIWAGALVGDDSGSRVRGFESQHRILDGHFFTFVCCKNSIVCLKKAANKRKRGRGWPIYKTQFFWNVARHGANVKDTVLK